MELRLILNCDSSVSQPALNGKSRFLPESFKDAMQVLSRTHTDADCTETIVCHCLQVSESTLSDAIAVCGAATVKEICRETGAGGGCTACHTRLREMLRKSRQSVPVC